MASRKPPTGLLVWDYFLLSEICLWDTDSMSSLSNLEENRGNVSDILRLSIVAALPPVNTAVFSNKLARGRSTVHDPQFVAAFVCKPERYLQVVLSVTQYTRLYPKVQAENLQV